MIYFPHPLSTLIKRRRSSRTFESREVDESRRTDLQKFIDACSNETFRFQLVESTTGPEGKKLGTYGVIKNGNLFIAAIAGKRADMFELGAVLETIVLYCTGLGLASCWLGGSFDRKGFSEQLLIRKDEYVPIVIPVGYPAAKPRMLEKFARFFVGANKRKNWDELFFNEGFDKPLTPAGAEDYKVPLESLRLAPSAVNRQPWRVLKDPHGYHFYLSRSISPHRYGFDMQMVDMGIGFSHFVLTARENYCRGKIASAQPQIQTKLEYVKSWIFAK